MRALFGPLGRLLWVKALASLYYFVASAALIRPSDGVDVALSLTSPIFLVWWVAADARRTRYWPCFHYGWWIALLSPVLVPHYLLRTRGRSALVPALALDLAILAPVLAWFLGWWAFRR